MTKEKDENMTVSLNVGGTHYEVARSTIEKYPDTMLAMLISDKSLQPKEGSEQKAFFIDRDGPGFSYVLDYMRDQMVHLPMNFSKEFLLQELVYYGFQSIPDDAISFQCPNFDAALHATQYTEEEQTQRHKGQPTRVPEATAIGISHLQDSGSGNRTPSVPIPDSSNPQQTLQSEPVLTPMDINARPYTQTLPKYIPEVDCSLTLSQVKSTQKKALKFYNEGDYRLSIRWNTEAIRIFSTLSREAAPPDLLAFLLSNRASGLLMIRAAEAAVDDCRMALDCVSSISSSHFTLANDRGPLLKAKLYLQLARALLSSGKAEQADVGLTDATRTAEDALARCREVHSLVELDRDEKKLSQITAEAALGKIDVSQFQQNMAKIAAFVLPSLSAGGAPLAEKSAVEALGEINAALRKAPACIVLHELKIQLLSSLQRWREVAEHCERLAVINVQFDGIFKGDLTSKNPFLDPPPAKALKANFFGDPIQEDYEARSLEVGELKLNTNATAEAVLRLPHSITASYLRSLRLEERYRPAAAAIKALYRLIHSRVDTPGYYQLASTFLWLSREENKLMRTKEERELADELFRAGDFSLAAAHYASCLKIDSEGMEEKLDSGGHTGGRLHAALHCNRAACLMGTRHFDEAVQECTAALQIHPRYMNAILRRSRCYAKMQQYEEAVNEYSKFLGLVSNSKQESSHTFLTPCIFDGPQKVTKDEVYQVERELEEARKMLEKKENEARKEATYQSERQKHWDRQQGTGNRGCGSFSGDSNTKKCSPKHKDQKQPHQSHGQSGRRSQTSAENIFATKQTHYGVLGIDQNATESDIKKAHRKIALKYHPDKNPDPNAVGLFLKAQTAYEVLKDASSRRQYDQEVRRGGRML